MLERLCCCTCIHSCQLNTDRRFNNRLAMLFLIGFGQLSQKSGKTIESTTSIIRKRKKEARQKNTKDKLQKELNDWKGKERQTICIDPLLQKVAPSVPTPHHISG